MSLEYIGLGIGLGFALGYGIFKFKDRKKDNRLINKLEVDEANRELKALLLEKDIITQALTTLYEAEVEGKITKEERERLASKYKEQLKKIEDKLSDLELLIQIGELKGLKDQLIRLFEDKLSKIESRLEGTKLVKREEVKKEEVKEEKIKKNKKSLTDEIYDALARLEQIDVEK